MRKPGETAAQVRAAVAADTAELAGVQLAAALAGFAHIFPESVAKPVQGGLEAEWTALIADPGKTVLAAISGAEIVAGVAFGHFPSLAPRGWGHLAKLYVLPGHAGRGIGSALHDLAVKQLRDAGYQNLWLWVLEGNERARHMYERRGWVPQPERRTDWPGSGVFEMGYALEGDPT